MSRSRTVEFLKGTVSTVLLQLVITASGFIIPRVMLTVYGSEINGVVSSLTQFINYFTLIEAGLGGAAIFALYKPLSEGNHSKINAIVVASKKLYMKSGMIFVGLIFILAFVFPTFTTLSSLNRLEVSLLTFIIGMTGVLDFFTLAKYRVLLTADQRVYILSLASTIYYILYTGIIAFASFFNVNIVVIRAMALSAMLVRSIILIIYCRKKYSWINFKETPDYSALKSKNDVLYQQICGMVQTGMPIVLATFIIKDFKAVSVFTIYNMVLTGINGVLGVFSTSLASGFGNLIVDKDKNLLRKTYNEFEAIYQILIAIVYSTTLFMIMPFVRLYTADVTDINYIIPIFAFLSVWNGAFYNIKTPLSMLVVSAGMYRETRAQNTITAIIIIALGIPLTFLYGLNGVMIASICSNLYRTIDFIFFVHKHITEDSPRNSIWRIVKVLLCMSIATVLTIVFSFQINSIISWIIHAILILISCVIVVGIIMGVSDRKWLYNLFIRFKRIFGR
jgi:polysaccharide transport protein, putative